MSIINQLVSIKQTSKKRVGRGYGSGKGGHTSGRGQKGQLSRRGAKIPLWFEGGNLPLVKRLPMQRGKGLLNPIAKPCTITLTQLQKLGLAQISLDTLKINHLVHHSCRVAKVLATGQITSVIELQGIQATQKAKQLIQKAGGKVS